ncbi:hypothetical protein [Actinoplanes sp. NPDC049681]|uniref:hypothetical protein n=1 Tax=Actinoplanes sp. NPDC049681 TaxID=3363905 RepID=UPI0037A4BADD
MHLRYLTACRLAAAPIAAATAAPASASPTRPDIAAPTSGSATIGMSANRITAGRSGIAAAAALAAGLGTLLMFTGRRGAEAQPVRPARRRPAPVPFLTAASANDLPYADGQQVLPDAPIDEHRHHKGTGVVVHPRAPLPLFDSSGRPFALIRPAHPGGETWLPVIEQQPGWLRVLLPARPHGVSGRLDATRVTSAASRHEILVHLDTARLQLLHDGRPIGTWPTATTPSTGLPTGRTFLLAIVRRTPHTAPILLRLATHGRADQPGLATICPQPTTGAELHNDACIGVPAAAMTVLDAVAPGCLVRICVR